MTTTKKRTVFKKQKSLRGSFKTGAVVIKELEEKGIKLGQGPKSKVEFFWEKIPENQLEIINIDAIMK